MPNLRVDPSSSMSQCCPAPWRVNGDTTNWPTLSELGQCCTTEGAYQIVRQVLRRKVTDDAVARARYNDGRLLPVAFALDAIRTAVGERAAALGPARLDRRGFSQREARARGIGIRIGHRRQEHRGLGMLGRCEHGIGR